MLLLLQSASPRPKAEIWFVRVGHRTLHRIGRRHDNRHGHPDRQATIWLPVRGPDEREIEAVVEGIDWFITLPPAFTVPLGLTSDNCTRGDEEWRRS